MALKRGIVELVDYEKNSLKKIKKIINYSIIGKRWF